jgi:hypothetical protein
MVKLIKKAPMAFIMNNNMAGYTLEQLKSMGAKKQGFTLDELKKTTPPSIPATKQSLASRILSDLTKRGKTAIQEFGKGVSGEISPMEGGIRALGQAAGGITDIIGEGIKSAVDIVPDVIKEPIKKVGVDILQTEAGKAGLNAIKAGVDVYSQWKSKNPRIAEDLEAIVNIGSLLPIGKGGQIIGKGAIRSVDVSADLVKQLTIQSEKSIEKSIIKNFEKGVKPLLPGKTSPTKLTGYRDDVLSAVKTINENKVNLTGQSPKSLQQLSEAVEQTKKTIFTKYDTLAKTAGEAGVGVDMAPIANELQTIISNKALSITSPETIKYAENLFERLSGTGKLDATTAQEVIQNYNASLQAFYRNPTYDTASKAAVDSMIANKMRQKLDDGISSLTGEQYSALKKQYGSLKSIEKDVIKASLRDARKNVKGLIDFSDIFSGGQVVSGLLSLNPAQIAQGLTQKGIASFYRYLNDPNRSIKNMFEVTSKLQSK